MDNKKVFAMSFSEVYPMLIAKTERKGNEHGVDIRERHRKYLFVIHIITSLWQRIPPLL